MLDTSGGRYRVVTNGPGSFSLIRSYLPKWALVAGLIGGVLFCGGGLLLLFVRRTETCMVAVVDQPTGALVTVGGSLRGEQLSALRSVLRAPAPTTPVTSSPPTGVSIPVRTWPSQPTPPVLGVPAVVLPEPPDPLQVETVVPRPGAVEAFEPPVDETVMGLVDIRALARASSSPRLVFDDGSQVTVSDRLLVGRDPAVVDPGDVASTLYQVLDAGRSVSKTHFAVGVLDGRVWIEERGSTNGTAVIQETGPARALELGDRAWLDDGVSVQFGDRTATLRWL